MKSLIVSRTLLIILFIYLTGAITQAQIIDTTFKDSLCSYTWNSAVNDCPDVLSCIYPGDWQGKHVDVPENITRISDEGLKLCLNDLQLKGSAEIIYIIDLSGSMDPSYNPSGDPFIKRPDAFLAGITFQRDSSSDKSRAAYIGFNDVLVSGHQLSLVQVKTQWTQLMNRYNTLYAYCHGTQTGGTRYNIAIDKAIEYFNDPSFVHDTIKAIIFISDGEPNANYGATPSQMQTLKNKKIPVFGIFLNKDHLGVGLDTICTKTGGKSYLVPPSATDTLAKVVKNVVSTLIKPFTGKSLTVTNTDNGSSANAISFGKLGDTAWAVKLDKSVFLHQGVNNISVVSKFGTTDIPPKDTTLQFQFFLHVGGQAPTQECYYCWFKTKLSILVNGAKVDTLSWQNTNYTLRIRYYGPDSSKLSSLNVGVRTLKGDTEFLSIPKFTHDGKAAIYERTVPFQVLLETTPAAQFNGITEANFFDLVKCFYQHPSDKLDTASACVEVVALPDSLKIFDKAGDPSLITMLQYNFSNKIDTVTAGKNAELYAKIFATVKWLQEYETNPVLSNRIKWTLVDNATQNPDPSIAVLSSDSGAHNTLFPKKAFKTIKVTASVLVNFGTMTATLQKPILLYIKPGDPRQLVIEATNDITKTNLNAPVPYDTIYIPGSTTKAIAYAILRDSLGNWVGPATKALWTSDQADVVTVAPGPSDVGDITKGISPQGTTQIQAEQTVPVNLKLQGTATVITQNFDIIGLRIIRINGTDTTDIESLTMSTNDDTTLYVLGKRSDNQKWIFVQGNWGINPAAITNPLPPQKSEKWSFSPTKPATGIIVATYSANNDTVRFNFTVGQVNKTTFRIITPDSLLIAGRPILAEVAIYNIDGLVPGIWKYPKDAGGNGGTNKAKYSDILDNGGLSYIPYAKTDTPDSAYFASVSGLYCTNVSQVFREGCDTLTFYLYYAPPDKKPHQLTVNLDGIAASTDQFILKPGPLDTIVLSVNNKIVSPLDTQYVTDKTPPLAILAKGYDKYGNFLPNEKFVWSNDPTLVDFNINTQSNQIFFDPGKATVSQKGNVIVKGVDHPDVKNQVPVKITVTLPDAISIFDKPGDPAKISMLEYNRNGKIDTVTAGTYADLYAKVFGGGKWFPQYEDSALLSKQISWTIVNNVTQSPDTTIAVLTSDSGSHNTLFPKKAYCSVKVTASLQITVTTLTYDITKSIVLYIKPGAPRQLVIEATNDFNKTANKYAPCPYDPIYLTKTTVKAYAFAILRDSLGNWVTPATQALWRSDSLPVVSVAPGPNDTGDITKGALSEGTTQIHAKQTVPGNLLLEDSSTVITLSYDIIGLRIVRIHMTDTAHIQNLTMSTNDDTTLYVLGQRSDDTTKWIFVQANWSIDPTGVTDVNPPQKSIRWSFSPTRPATGVIAADFMTVSDTVRFTFTTGNAVRATFRIVTPDSLLIAGEPILGEVAIYNKDGLVPGLWKYPKNTGGNGGYNKAFYSDILDNGNLTKYIPYARTDIPDSAYFSATGGTYATMVVQTFREGYDTLTFYLYNAPPTKDPHKLSVNLDGIGAVTNQFILKPGPLDTIILSINNSIVSSKDTQYLTNKSSPFMIKAKGYDKYGNSLPDEKFKWHNDSSLVDYKLNTQSDQILFDPSQATGSQKGKVIVAGVDHPKVTNHLVIIITGPTSNLLKATTRDNNGNGYLDAIELVFDRAFNLPQNLTVAQINAGITVLNTLPAKLFTIDSITMAPLGANKKFIMHMMNCDSVSKLNKDLPQTAWTPALTIKPPVLSDSVSGVTGLVCTDGAGPVVWTVVKKVNDVNDLRKDEVTVVLSENFNNANGSPFLSAAPTPEAVFNVYIKNQNGAFVKVDSILAKIPNFNSQKNDNTVFTMSNGKDLNDNHWINLDHILGYVADNVKNVPNANNQKVRVAVTGNIGKIIIAPIPIIPTKTLIDPSLSTTTLKTFPIEKIYNQVTTNGGCMIVVKIQVDVDDKGNMLGRLDGTLLVFDAVGNLVHKCKNENNLLYPTSYVRQDDKSKGLITLGFYWDGISTNGMKSSIGVYRLIMHLTYDGNSRAGSKYKTNIAEVIAVGR